MYSESLNRVSCDEQGIAAAAHTVSKGGTIIYPTDTVYAIGCNPFNADAVAAIYKIKKRDSSKQMPILCATSNDAWKLVDVQKDERSRVEKFWPGALSIVAPLHNTKLIDTLMLSDNKIAVRVPAGNCTRKILDACGPLVGTSANISGSTPTQSPDYIENLDADLLIDGDTIRSSGKPSTIIEIGNTLQIIRKGAISAGELEKIWTS